MFEVVSSNCFQCTKHYEFGKECTNILDEFTNQVLKVENNYNDTIKVEVIKLRSENDNLKMQLHSDAQFSIMSMCSFEHESSKVPLKEEEIKPEIMAEILRDYADRLEG